MAWSPDYTSASDLKAYLRIDDTLDDAQVGLAIAAASRAVDRHCNRQFGLLDAPAARTYTARYDRGRGRWILPIDDLMTTTGLAVQTVTDTITDTITDWSLQPGNAAADARPWTRLVVTDAPFPTADENGVTVTARWGWTTVPPAVQQATLLQASRLLKRRDAPFGIAGSPELGSELRLLAKVDPDVAVTLAAYQRRRAVA